MYDKNLNHNQGFDLLIAAVGTAEMSGLLDLKRFTNWRAKRWLEIIDNLELICVGATDWHISTRSASLAADINHAISTKVGIGLTELIISGFEKLIYSAEAYFKSQIKKSPTIEI